MAKPVSRALDKTDDGAVVVDGFATVEVEGLPIITEGCKAVCPIHGAALVSSIVAPNLFAHGLRVAMEGGKCACQGAGQALARFGVAVGRSVAAAAQLAADAQQALDARLTETSTGFDPDIDAELLDVNANGTKDGFKIESSTYENKKQLDLTTDGDVGVVASQTTQGPGAELQAYFSEDGKGVTYQAQGAKETWAVDARLGELGNVELSTNLTYGKVQAWLKGYGTNAFTGFAAGANVGELSSAVRGQRNIAGLDSAITFQSEAAVSGPGVGSPVQWDFAPGYDEAGNPQICWNLGGDIPVGPGEEAIGAEWAGCLGLKDLGKDSDKSGGSVAGILSTLIRGTVNVLTGD